MIRLAVLLPHLGGLAGTGLNGGHQFVGEVVALDVGDLGSGVVAADDVGDGVDQVGLAKAGVPVDQQGVVVLGRMLRNRHRRRVGQLVGGAHHEGLEGELPALHQGGRLLLLLILVAAQPLVVQKPYRHVGGEDVLESRLDIGEEPVLDIGALEVVGTVEHQGIPLQGHHRGVVKPGLDGGLRQLLPESGQYHGPDIGNRLHRSSPFLCV